MVNKLKDLKRRRGRVFTNKNPFKFDPFWSWISQFDAKSVDWLEPFAGSNNLIKMLIDMGVCKKFSSFDINPKDLNVKRRDTLKRFPKGYSVGVTNPPWLAKNSAKRRGLHIEEFREYKDLYQLCIAKCLDNLDYLCAIIPESFITSGLFVERLQCVVSITEEIFDETSCPCCLAMWGKNKTNDFDVWIGNDLIGSHLSLSKHIPISNFKSKVTFNDPKGSLGLMAVDSTKGPSIRFVIGNNIPAGKIKVSSRSITRISIIPNPNIDIAELVRLCNLTLRSYRIKTNDAFLTSFKGLRSDGRYRRRLDWKTASAIIDKTLKVR